jgi:hypothetical protein
MTRTRTAALTVALALLGPLVAAGCTVSPSTTRLTSPYISWSSTQLEGGFQGASVNACSAAGGPVTVTILDRQAGAPPMSVGASINLGGQAFDGSPRLTTIGDTWTSLPLPANSCFAVFLLDDAGTGAPKFRFRIDW